MNDVFSSAKERTESIVISNHSLSPSDRFRERQRGMIPTSPTWPNLALEICFAKRSREFIQVSFKKLNPFQENCWIELVLFSHKISLKPNFASLDKS